MIYDKLYDWQKSIVDKFKHRKSFGLFLDMGLGKTPLSLAFAESNHCEKILIVTINSKATETADVDGSWLNWSLNFKDYKLTNKWSDEHSSKKEIFLINYEGLFERGKNKKEKVTIKSTIQKFIDSCKNTNVAIIIDESHKMKNLQSMQTLAIMKIKKSLERQNNVFSYLLSGTPFTTGYIDLYSQLKMLGYESTKGTFIDEYCIRGNVPGLLGWQQPIVGYKNLSKLYDLIHRFAITIKSEEVIGLPEKIFVYHTYKQTNEFELFASEKAKINDIKNLAKKLKVEYLAEEKNNKLVNNVFYRNIDYPDDKFLCETIGTFWLRARQLSIGFQGNSSEFRWYDKTRLDELNEFLKENEDNYVLFYNYTPELFAIYDLCDKLGYNIDVYCGEIKSLIFYEQYNKQTELEKSKNRKNIILANFASGSTGMNWQAYNKCIIFSIPLYKDYEQGIKRIHRLGQQRTTFYHVFYQQCWLDESMIKSLNSSIEYSIKMFESDIERIHKIMEDKNE